ncbi:MAG: bifunctional riboflavin kinase/FAD synthetase [Cellulophaga sp.]|uniref:bifunctional riboflavin kinase/FAD synthetase n=1 Tax=Cellulophaga sp. TaxID=1972202 RepID=UPI003266E07F
MITIKSISKFDKAHATVITIGTFDGVHIGHKKILERLINSAKLLEIESTVLTFFPHPRMVLQQDSNIKLLNTIEEKEMILSNLGLDFLIIHPFSKEFSRLSAIEFVRDLLVNKLNTKKIIIGYDHRFGRNRNADINDLRNYGTTFDFNVEEITAQEIDDVSVSSTKIRKALAEGDVSKANSYLGYNYMLTGIVTKGKGLGRQLNYPTANIYIKEEYKLIPKNGVYAVKAKLNNSTVFGMMNIGYNPTVNGTEKTIEVNFFNFDDDLYGKKIQVDILDRIRDEVKFNSLDDLKKQLAKDQETATSLIAKL